MDTIWRFTTRRAAAQAVVMLLDETSEPVDVLVFPEEVFVRFICLSDEQREIRLAIGRAHSIMREAAGNFRGKGEESDADWHLLETKGIQEESGAVTPWVEAYRGRDGCKRFKGYSFRVTMKGAS